MRIALGTDERTALFDALVSHLEANGHQVGVAADGIPWPQVGGEVGRAVAGGAADLGVVSCTTGTGVCIAANKVHGIRAALCTDAETAKGARRWNDANVLAYGIRLTTESLAFEMVDAFLATPFDQAEADLVASVEAKPDMGRAGGL
ncbi:MAG: RpiB/LacA/LacB family sugar-phosphate isomerase [Acidimicrobiales bacterium]